VRIVWTHVHTEGIAAKQQRNGLVMSDTVSDYQSRLLRPSHWPSAVMDRLRPVIHRDGRVAHHVVGRFLRDLNNATLVSFPRTGSHWFRLICEEYFERPTLVRVFTEQHGRDFLFIHTHDNDLRVERPNVLYLYRDATSTIFSQMQYEKEPLDDSQRVVYWAHRYARHLKKWLIDETFTTTKTTLRYERLRQDPAGEFAKVAAHFGQPLDEGRLQEVMDQCSKRRIRSQTERYDPQVIDASESYERRRGEFHAMHRTRIQEVLGSVDEGLPSLLAQNQPQEG
jgi:hypothetical protein